MLSHSPKHLILLGRYAADYRTYGDSLNNTYIGTMMDGLRLPDDEKAYECTLSHHGILQETA
jgi:uncharacterized protein YbgA (DUF1722 family)